MNNILSIATFIPLTAAIIMGVLLRGDDKSAQNSAKWLALTATLATLLISLAIIFGFDPQNTEFQFVEEHNWLLGMNYKMGVDGISVLFVMLTTFLMPIVMIFCYRIIFCILNLFETFLEIKSIIIRIIFMNN